MIRGSFGLSALIFVGALTMAVTSQPSAAADNGARRVRNVVLVHGAWADGSSWAKVIHRPMRSEEHTSELQSQSNLVCRLLLEKKKKTEEALLNSPAAT